MSRTERRTAANVARAREVLRDAGFDAVVTSRPEDAAYLTSRRAFIYRALAEGRLAECVILTRDQDPLLLTMDAYVPFYSSVGIQAAGMSRAGEVIAGWTKNATRVAVPPECPQALRQLVEQNTAAEVTDSDPLAVARISKQPEELEAMRDAVAVAEAGMKAMLGACEAGATEAEVVARGESRMRELGAESLCFSTLCVSGPELGLMREVTTTRTLQQGDWVMLDGGCAVDGYNAEFARSLRIGGVDATYADAYAAVKQAQEEAIGCLRAGATGQAVDAAARESLSQAGFGEQCYAHITGHGIGTGVWEGPALAPDATEPLPAGAVVSVEPGVFIPKVGGIRIEDLCVITEDGAEVLTNRRIGQMELALAGREA